MRQIVPYELYHTLLEENAALRERIRDLEGTRYIPPLSPGGTTI